MGSPDAEGRKTASPVERLDTSAETVPSSMVEAEAFQALGEVDALSFINNRRKIYAGTVHDGPLSLRRKAFSSRPSSSMDMSAPAGAFGGRGPPGAFPPFERNGGMDRGPPMMDMGGPMMMDMGMHTQLTHPHIGKQ